MFTTAQLFDVMQLVYPVTLWAAAKVYFPPPNAAEDCNASVCASAHFLDSERRWTWSTRVVINWWTLSAFIVYREVRVKIRSHMIASVSLWLVEAFSSSVTPTDISRKDPRRSRNRSPRNKLFSLLIVMESVYFFSGLRESRQ